MPRTPARLCTGTQKAVTLTRAANSSRRTSHCPYLQQLMVGPAKQSAAASSGSLAKHMLRVRVTKACGGAEHDV